eukprot:TRINITY_DN2583_c0_g2_i5.p1 TRINITY_DN2583_c0_g2~~TRINITY_DN2583_c0_g2_i5.p1  ORF type:complete len:156 (-),score=16.78 TRINITY_DN2583_c0_g2_i5:302-769(-)
MALNPPASGKGIPRRVQGEVLVAQRGEMELELRITGRQTVVAKGTVLLSTIRVVFVPGKEGDFAGVELPLATIHTERLNQPISGPPFLSGPQRTSRLTAQARRHSQMKVKHPSSSGSLPEEPRASSSFSRLRSSSHGAANLLTEYFSRRKFVQEK